MDRRVIVPSHCRVAIVIIVIDRIAPSRTMVYPLQDGLQEGIFPELFAAAEIANFSSTEQETYQNSLKYYRDMNNVVDTARQEGKLEGKLEGIELERSRILERDRALLLRLLSRTLGELPDRVKTQMGQLSSDQLEALNEVFIDFVQLDELLKWLDRVSQ